MKHLYNTIGGLGRALNSTKRAQMCSLIFENRRCACIARVCAEMIVYSCVIHHFRSIDNRNAAEISWRSAGSAVPLAGAHSFAEMEAFCSICAEILGVLSVFESFRTRTCVYWIVHVMRQWSSSWPLGLARFQRCRPGRPDRAYDRRSFRRLVRTLG